MATVLLGDIGGTNVRLQVVRISEAGVEDFGQGVFAVREFTSLQSCLIAFLRDKPACSLFVLGITEALLKVQFWEEEEEEGRAWAPVSEGEVRLLGIRKVIMLNDVEVAGYGVLELCERQLHLVNPGASPVLEAPKILLSLGTGMGCSILLCHQGEYRSVHSEAGFADFAAKSLKQYKYRYFTRHNLSESSLLLCEVPNEVAVAGSYGTNMYKFFVEENPELEDKAFTAVLEKRPSEAFSIWVQAGFAGSDRISVLCVDFLAELLGGIAGNIATAILPSGGVYFAGGVILKNLPGFLSRSHIITKAFLSRPRHIRKLLENVPIFFVDPEVEVGLKGALHYAKRLTRNEKIS